jgi:hypothetical protein
MNNRVQHNTSENNVSSYLQTVCYRPPSPSHPTPLLHGPLTVRNDPQFTGRIDGQLNSVLTLNSKS